MGFLEDFYKNLDKEKREALQNRGTTLGAGEKSSALSWRNDEIAPVREEKTTSKWDDDDIAPVKEEKRTWFDKGVFDDGYQFGDIFKGILGTSTDATTHIGAGVIGIGEKLTDAGAMLGTALNRGSMMQAANNEIMYNAILGKEESASKTLDRYNKAQGELEKETTEFVAKDLYNEEEIAKKIISDPVKKVTGIDSEEDSFFGEKTDALAQSAGQLGAQIAFSAIPGIGQVGGMALMGTTAFGSEAESAFNQGATFDEGMLSATISAGAEILTEKLGGISFGGKTVTDAIFGQMSSKMTSKLANVLISTGKITADALAEGGEELLSGYIGALGQQMTYMEDKEIEELFSNEDKLESFIGGVVLGGIGGTGEAVTQGKGYVTGLNKSEQKVVDKLYNDATEGKNLTAKEKKDLYNNIVENMDKGDIDIDTIESILGGEDYKAYKEIADLTDGMTKEFDELGNKTNPTLAEQYRYSSLMEKIKGSNEQKKAARTKLDETMSPFLKNSRLAESYNEVARKKEAFNADLTQYDEKQRVAVERAIKSGVLNNTNKSHALVNTLSKIEADKGIVFDYTNNKKLKESGFAIEGKTVNGFEKNGTVTLNVQSAKSWQSTVGHEITHVLEGTDAYGTLQETLFKYAESKGELETRRTALTELYNGIEADIDKELTADLVGDYLFSDKDFIRNLTGDVNLFKKCWNEVKYFCKVATGRELTEIEKVRQEFDKVWKEYSAKGATAESGNRINYHISANFEAEIDKTLNNEMAKNNQVKARDFTPEILVKNGVNDLPMLITQNHIKSIVYSETEAKKLGLPTGKNKNYHGLGKELLVKSIDNMDSPSEIYKQDENHYLIITELQNSNGEDIIIPVMIDGKGTYNDVYIDENQILSAYGKKNLQEYLDKNNFELIYTKKGTALNEGVQYSNISSSTLQATEGRRSENTPFNQQSVSEDIVTENGNDVKTNFSLSKSVEETKNLVALHNLTSDKLNKVMDLGGFPMPSIAVTRTDIPHTNFGDITLVMNKSTIDPKANRKNTVYSADAWTPTVPRTEYKPNSTRLSEISNKVYELVGDRNIVNKLDYVAFDTDNVSRDLEQTDGNLTNKYLNNNTMKYAFLKDIGAKIEMPTKEAALSRGVSNEVVRYFSGKLTNGLQTVEHYQNMSATEMLNDKELTNAVAEVLNWDVLRQFEEGTENYEKLKANPLYKADDLSYSQIDSLLDGVRKYFNRGIEQTIDGREAKNVINNYFNDNNLQERYEIWLNEMFEGVVEKTGIYNNKELFTPSGNRRTFEQLHLPVTLENIVKAMASQNNGNTKNVAGFNGVKTLRAGMAERFKSIADMHKLEGRLKNLTAEEFDAITDQLSERMNKVISSILETAPETGGNIYMRMDSIGETLMEIAESGNYSTDAIVKTVNQYIYNIDESIAEDIRTLLYDVSQMPTNMFEAKPERAVGFDEVSAAILPDGADNALRERLERMGVKVLTYEKGNDTDRLSKLNSLLEEQPDLKFSLSKQGEQIAPIGNYSTPLNETALAPMQETISKTETVETADNATVDDIAPMPTDADAPPIMETEYYNAPDTTALDEKALNNIGKSLRETLSLTAEETKAIQEIVQEYSTSEMPNREELFKTIKEKFGEKYTRIKLDDIAEVKQWLRTKKLYISDHIKSDITDYAQFRKDNRNKIKFSNDGIEVSDYYDELVSQFPEFFHYGNDEEFGNLDVDKNQIKKIAAVANQGVFDYKVDVLNDDIIQQAVDIISNEVANYKNTLNRTAAEETAREALDSIAPSRAEQLTDGSRGDALLIQSLDNHPIKTVEDRIAENIRAVQGNIADNQVLRRESIAKIDKEIERLSNEYVSKKDKNTQVANKLISRISKLYENKARIDANYAKTISDLEARLEKMQTPKYNKAMHKKAKMQEYADWAKELIGNTKNWVDKKIGLQYATNTERRNLRDIVRDENGNQDIAKADKINDELNGQYNREEAALKKELTQIRKKYADLKITKHESEYIQMLGEFRHSTDTELTEKEVKEYYEKHKKHIDTGKVDKVIDLARKDYDDLINRLNAVLREQGMKEIPYRQGYFPHFTVPKQNFVQKLLNWKTQDNEIPTSIAGLTEDFKPVKSWQAFDKTRHSDTTDYNFLQGFDNYSKGALDWIYHIETLQKRRAVENYIRYTHSDEGIKTAIKEVYADENLDADEAQARIENILAQAKNPLNNFVQDFMTHTNILAGKKNSLDRTAEQMGNRNIYTVMMNVQNRTSANMVLANVRSALTNFIPITQSWAQVSPLRSLQATKDTIANAIKDDGMVEKSTFLTNRLREADNLYKTNWDKVLDKAGIMFEVVDNFSSQVIWRSKYKQNLAKGMSESEAIANADQFAENVMAGRSKGNEPTLFNAKNPFVKAFTMFQLEVNNQYGYLFKDAPNDLKAETEHWKLNLAKGYTTAFIGAYVYNALLEQVAGSGAALDPIGIIEDLLKDLGLFDDDEEKETAEVVPNLIKNVGGELPFVGGTLFGGGRIPIASAFPYGGDGLVNGIGTLVEDVSEGNWGNIGKEMMAPILNVGLPVGGGQIKKTYQGLKMFDTNEDHPVAGSYTDSGALRFPVDDTIGNRIQAGIFGQYASKNAREYFDGGYAPLKEKQIEEYMDVDMPIADYWKYREGLKGLKGNAEKADYINSLDITDRQKNVLMNNILDRKEDVDMSYYDNYNSFEEFDYAQKNPKKYAFFNENGISYDYYSSLDEDGKAACTWAYNNPEKYKVSKVVTDNVVEYRSYTSDLYDIRADKDANGDSISGSAKEKKIDYINNLDLEYGQKIILLKMQYKSDDTYNADIIDYLNNIDNLSYEDRIAIFTELGFTVKDGYVYWD